MPDNNLVSTLPRGGSVSISRIDTGKMTIFISEQFRVSARAVTDEQLANMAIDLAQIVSKDVWRVVEINRSNLGSAFVKVETVPDSICGCD